MRGHILAMGGEALSADSKLDRLLVELSGKERPRAAYLPTAVADDRERIEAFHEAFGALGCETDAVMLFGMPERPFERVASADVVYVSGGNTANMLAVWRVHGIDVALRQVWENGGALGGPSAGGICWFEDGLTDSFRPDLRPLGDGLGWLGGSFCPHFDGEPMRRPLYLNLIREGMLPPGLAADDDAALLFAGTELVEAVSQREGARCWRVGLDGDEPIPARAL